MEWVQTRVIRRIERDGVLKTYLPRQWVEVGKQTADKWEAEGTIEGRVKAARPPAFPVPQPAPGASAALPLDAGIVALRDAQKVTDLIGKAVPGLQVTSGAPKLAYERTLLWDPAYNLQLRLLSIGFHLLTKWQVAVPLHRYDRLALSFGNVAERAALEKVIHDLRVMVYDPRCVFLRRSKDSERLLELWQAYEGDSRLGFLKAVYEVKPVLNALPVTWGGGRWP